MAKKSSPISVAPLRPRVERALAEGRTQQALDLANQLFKQEPDDSSRELLQRVTLARAKQMRGEGKSRDAVVVLQAKLNIGGGDVAWRIAVAEELAACAAIAPALAALAGIEDPAPKARILARVADAAIDLGPPGRDQLPEDLRPAFDLVLKAFRLHAESKDDEAREALQGIGLQSPFLEWKLLLRGLMAFQAKDDARACENWQRLNPERTPARLAAPLRLGIDSAFASAQPGATQLALRKSADRLMGNADVVPSLRAMQAMLARPDRLHEALSFASNLVPTLRQQFPDLVPRLQACFFWAVVHSEEESNLPRFARAFDVPAYDPQAAHLAALLWDERGDAEYAHKHWHALEQTIARQPATWSGGHGASLRSLILQHMALIIDSCEPPPGMSRKSGMFDDMPKFKPNEEACLKQSIALAPDRREPYLALLTHYEKKGKPEFAKADTLAQTILERFPDEATVWESMASRASSRDAWDKAAEYLAEALKRSPLNVYIRDNAAGAHLMAARQRAESGQMEAARASFAEALTLVRTESRGRAFALWASAEFAANEVGRSQELRDQANADPISRLPFRFAWLIEVIRHKRGKTMKTEAERELREALAETLPPGAVVGVVRAACLAREAGKYTGQAGHEKKVLALLAASDPANFTEAQLELVCEALQLLEAYAVLRKWALAGQKRFPQNPFLAVAEAFSHMAPKGKHCQPWAAMEPLGRARSLAEALPDGSARSRLFRLVAPLLERLQPIADLANGPLTSMMDEIFGRIDLDDEFLDDERPRRRRGS